jgi:NADH-quinone oxidoreductase subunit F
MKPEYRIILRKMGVIDPESIGEAVASGGYNAARKAIHTDPDSVISAVVSSGLRGRGGAGFPSGMKLRYVRDASLSGIKYLVCNADEGEPGTFKDRLIMENDPHLLIEGMIIAAVAAGITKGYIYLRGEYFRSVSLMSKAIRDARSEGFIGNNIFHSGYNFDIELRIGAGSYLCGEELTLIESIEGRRGYPRIKPPFPSEKGINGMPTLVFNVETLANLPAIIANGPDWYRSIGMPDSPGTKIFCISGDVTKPGFCETETGITLRELIFGHAGGIRNGRRLRAVLTGGAAGTFVNDSLLDIPVGFDSLRARGAVLGSGAVMVMDETRDLIKMTASLLRFFKHESCGKCVPCRVGTAQLISMTDEIIRKGVLHSTDLDRMVDEAEFMSRTSLCPLGQSPVLPLRSLKQFFKSELTV